MEAQLARIAEKHVCPDGSAPCYAYERGKVSARLQQFCPVSAPRELSIRLSGGIIPDEWSIVYIFVPYQKDGWALKRTIVASDLNKGEAEMIRIAYEIITDDDFLNMAYMSLDIFKEVLTNVPPAEEIDYPTKN